VGFESFSRAETFRWRDQIPWTRKSTPSARGYCDIIVVEQKVLACQLHETTVLGRYLSVVLGTRSKASTARKRRIGLFREIPQSLPILLTHFHLSCNYALVRRNNVYHIEISVRTVVRTVAFPRPPTVEVPCVYLQEKSEIIYY